MPSKMDEFLAMRGLSDPAKMFDHATRQAVKYTFLRVVFNLVFASLADRVDRSGFGDIILGWSDKFEMRIQPDFLIAKFPHVHRDGEMIEIALSSEQIFSMVFETVSNAIFEDVPTVDENGKISGPTVYFTEGVYLKLTSPGLPDSE